MRLSLAAHIPSRHSADMPTHPPILPTTTPAAAASTGSMIACQAIVNSDKEVMGYELFNRSRAPTEHTAATDVILLFTAFSHAGSEDLLGAKLLFVSSSHECLAGGHLELLNPEKVVLEVEPLGHVASAEVAARLPILRALRERGFKLSFNHTVLESVYATWLPLADYIKLDLNVLRPEQLAVLVSYAARHSQGRLIATKMETPAQFDLLQSLGVALFQGSGFSRPAMVEAKLLAPSQASIIELIHWLRRQASTDKIEAVIKKDAGLAFNLMRLIHSTGFNTAREITSLRQAVLTIGVKKLLHWATLLLTASQFGKHSAPVSHTAVVRGRLMELLARECLSQEDAEQAFMVGVFSLLDAMLSIPLRDALQLIHVPTAVTQALLEHEGTLGELLRLAKACESSHSEAFDHATAILALTRQQIHGAHQQALAWPEQITP